MAKRKCTNEQIIAALLEHGTVSAAARACGISTRTVRERMNERDFQILYQEAKADIVRSAVISIDQKLNGVIDILWSILNSEDVSPAVKIQAGQCLLSHAGKLAARLTDAETANQEANQPRNPWDLW